LNSSEFFWSPNFPSATNSFSTQQQQCKFIFIIIKESTDKDDRKETKETPKRMPENKEWLGCFRSENIDKQN
jgi:hypothetical protein